MYRKQKTHELLVRMEISAASVEKFGESSKRQAENFYDLANSFLGTQPNNEGRNSNTCKVMLTPAFFKTAKR